MSYRATGGGTMSLNGNVDYNEITEKIKNIDLTSSFEWEIIKENNTIAVFDCGSYDENKIYNFLNTILPYTKKGCIDYTGEDNAIWRIKLVDNKWVEEDGRIDYNGESYTDQELISILSQRGYVIKSIAD